MNTLFNAKCYILFINITHEKYSPVSCNKEFGIFFYLKFHR